MGEHEKYNENYEVIEKIFKMKEKNNTNRRKTLNDNVQMTNDYK